MEIKVYEEDHATVYETAKSLADTATMHFSLIDRVPDQEGMAFDLTHWYESWTHETRTPTHLKVEAIDEFQAIIPWQELGQAAVLYEQHDQPIKKGFPIRLYVPNGSSNCLNVKSVVKIHFLHRSELAQQATFGFKNEITAEELLPRSKSEMKG